MKQFFRIVFLLLLPLLFLCGCAGPSADRNAGSLQGQEPRQVHSEGTAMGTVIQQNIYTRGEDCTEDIAELITGLEEDTFSWRLETSELYRLNQAAGSAGGTELTDEMAQILRQCLELTEASGGAFDIAIGPVARLWDIDGWAAGEREGEFRPPDGEALSRALALCGSRRIRLQTDADPEAGGEVTLFYSEAGTELDLGAVGKGAALTHILKYLESDSDITGAVVSVGGSVLTYGEKPDKSLWKIGIVDPADPKRNLGILTLEGQWCISTSGDYERFAEADGVRYHHILDPATGYPARSGLSSVTVVTKDGLLSDALATACFVLGEEKGTELAKRYGAEALFVGESGEITMTSGMEKLFQRR